MGRNTYILPGEAQGLQAPSAVRRSLQGRDPPPHSGPRSPSCVPSARDERYTGGGAVAALLWGWREGAVLADERLMLMVCRECGGVIVAMQVVCPHCGAVLTSGTDAAPPVAQLAVGVEGVPLTDLAASAYGPPVAHVAPPPGVTPSAGAALVPRAGGYRPVVLPPPAIRRQRRGRARRVVIALGLVVALVAAALIAWAVAGSPGFSSHRGAGSSVPAPHLSSSPQPPARLQWPNSPTGRGAPSL